MLQAIICTSLQVGLLSSFCFSAITKYLFECVLNNPVGCCSRFWTAFIYQWTFGFAITSQISWHIVTPRLPIGYYTCSGRNPNCDGQMAPKFYGVIELFTFTLLCMVIVKLKIRKLRLHYGPMTRGAFLRSRFLEYYRSMCLNSVLSNLGSLLILAIQISNTYMLNSLDPEVIRSYPFHYYALFVLLLLPSFLILIPFIVFYAHQRPLRIFLIKEFKDYFFNTQ